MDLKTFFGAIRRLVISQMAISKSICGNLNSLYISVSLRRPIKFEVESHRLKNLGIRISDLRLESETLPNRDESPY